MPSTEASVKGTIDKRVYFGWFGDMRYRVSLLIFTSPLVAETLWKAAQRLSIFALESDVEDECAAMNIYLLHAYIVDESE